MGFNIINEIILKEVIINKVVIFNSSALTSISALSVFGFLLNFLIHGLAHAEFLVKDIVIHGNNKTQDTIITRELSYSVNDKINEVDLKQSEQNIRDLGLFKMVKIDTDQITDGIITAIHVEEKRYNFVLPKLARNGEGDVSTGLAWRASNLTGRNQNAKLEVVYTEFSEADANDAVAVRFKYHYPRIGGGKYSLRLGITGEQTNLTEEIDRLSGEYDREYQSIDLEGGRWMQKKGPSHGIKLSFGLSAENYEHTLLNGTAGLLPDPNIINLVGGFNYINVRNYHYSRSGSQMSYKLRLADTEFGSDISYLDHRFYYRRYVRLSKTEHTNLNFQLSIGSITRSVLGPPQHKIGGNSQLRGYDRDSVEGNSYLVFNSEWMRPVFKKETLRTAAFIDVGNAWPRLSDATFSGLRVGAGFGLRWYLKSFVKTILRIDIAKGFASDGKTKLYVSTNATF